MSAALTVSFWLVWGVGAFVLALLVAGLVIAAGTFLYHGFDVEPVQDRHDDRDPWLQS